MARISVVRWTLLVLVMAAGLVVLPGTGIFRANLVAKRSVAPTPPNADMTTLSALARGDAAFESGDFPAAVSAYTEVLARVPNSAETYNNRGLASYRLGNTDAALADFNQALALRPDYVNALTNRAIALFDQGDYNAVVADTTRAVALDPEADSAFMFRGNAYQRLGDLRGALANWARANAIRMQRQAGGY
jgi:tetratricopeptide (TPR) repeat protein